MHGEFKVPGGKLVVTDGPFTEAKEVVAGFAVFEFATKQDAVAGAVSDTATTGSAIEAGRLAGAIERWVVIPADAGKWPE